MLCVKFSEGTGGIDVILNIILGKRIRHYRNLYSMTQSELAEEIGVEAMHIANIENGRKGISLEKLVLICRCFHVNLSDVLPIEVHDDIELRKQRKEDIINMLDCLDSDQLGIIRKIIISLSATS